MYAARIFSRKQALEKEIKDLYLEFTVGDRVAATATLAVTDPIELTSVALGSARNTNTFTVQVAAAAANPTDTVLAVFTGTAAAIVCTITPNDGTNNSDTPVDLTTEELVELINSGEVVGKEVTVTDASSLRALQTATGGGDDALADAGEGDAVVGTFAGGGADAPTIVSGQGFASVEWSATGTFLITLSDKYPSVKYIKAIIKSTTAQDFRSQVKATAVDTGPTVTLMTTTGATAADPANGTKVHVKMEMKNTAV